MKKAITLIVCTALTAALLAACGAQPAEPDLDELAFQLRDSAGFGEEMYLLDEGIARELYGLGTDASCVAWSGAGATAEELAVFETASAGDAQELLERLWERNESRIADYGSYLPDEVPKLENSLILAEGRFVLLCTAQDSSGARQLWKATFGG